MTFPMKRYPRRPPITYTILTMPKSNIPLSLMLKVLLDDSSTMELSEKYGLCPYEIYKIKRKDYAVLRDFFKWRKARNEAHVQFGNDAPDHK